DLNCCGPPSGGPWQVLFFALLIIFYSINPWNRKGLSRIYNPNTSHKYGSGFYVKMMTETFLFV
ncbi:MAG: hypothetical protein KA794_21500, partial [Candidatus Obscuribacter sp.]|nr:hypothetical protein [Candidatus Obscuribacter sp.]